MRFIAAIVAAFSAGRMYYIHTPDASSAFLAGMLVMCVLVTLMPATSED